MMDIIFEFHCAANLSKIEKETNIKSFKIKKIILFSLFSFF